MGRGTIVLLGYVTAVFIVATREEQLAMGRKVAQFCRWCLGLDLEQNAEVGTDASIDGYAHCVQIWAIIFASSGGLIASAFTEKNTSLILKLIYALASLILVGGFVMINRAHDGKRATMHYFNFATVRFSRVSTVVSLIIATLLFSAAIFETGPFAAELNSRPGRVLGVLPYQFWPPKSENKSAGVQVLVRVSSSEFPEGQFPESLIVRCHFRNEMNKHWKIDPRSQVVYADADDATMIEMFRHEEQAKATKTLSQFIAEAHPFLSHELNERRFGTYGSTVAPLFPTADPLASTASPDEFHVYLAGIPPKLEFVIQFRFIQSGELSTIDQTEQLRKQFMDGVANFEVTITEPSK